MKHQKSFDNFLPRVSSGAVCKVWYKLVNLPGRSEKAGLRHFANLRGKKEAEVGVAYIARFSRIQGTFGFFEFATNITISHYREQPKPQYHK